MAEARKFKWVGTRPIRHDGVDKVTGRASFGADLAFADMLWGRVLRSPHAHAKDPPARRLEGARAAGREGDRHRRGSPRPPGRRGRRHARAASTSATCRTTSSREGRCSITATRSPRSPRPRKKSRSEALAAIEVEYEPLPPVLSIDAAIAPGAPVLHAELKTRGAERRIADQRRLAHRVRARRRGAGLREGRRRGRARHSRRRPCTRATSSRTPWWRAPNADGQSTSGAARRARSRCARYCAAVLGLRALAAQA